MVAEPLTNSTELPVSEVFGPTLQGEGPYAGRPATFVRFMGCNLSCSWCDSAYTWDASRFNLKEQRQQMTADEIAHDVLTRGFHNDLTVLTGGEPLLHQNTRGWKLLIDQLVHRSSRQIHLETNGTLAPNQFTMDRLSAVMVSPKLTNAGPHRGHQDPTLHPRWPLIARMRRTVHLKVVCQTPKEVGQVVQWAAEIAWPREQVWVMPEGATAAELAERWPAIAAAAAHHSIAASHRLHVLAWGSERGH